MWKIFEKVLENLLSTIKAVKSFCEFAIPQQQLIASLDATAPTVIQLLQAAMRVVMV